MRKEHQYKFKTPEGYFDELKADLNKIPAKHSPRENGILKHMWLPLSAAALILLGIFILPSQQSETTIPDWEQISSEALVSYLQDQPEVLFNEYLYFTGIEFSNMGDQLNETEISEEELEEYLLEQNVDL